MNRFVAYERCPVPTAWLLPRCVPETCAVPPRNNGSEHEYTLADLAATVAGTIWAESLSIDRAVLNASVANTTEVAANKQQFFDPRQVVVGPAALDSRIVRRGEVFWAFRGARCDGNDFAIDALNRGAAAAVVERVVPPPAQCTPAPAPRVLVADTRAALERWAEYCRANFVGTLIGVTGSMGKTTTCTMLDQVLSGRFAGAAPSGNWNNELGVPLTLSRLRRNHHYAVVEMGARRLGDIAHLAARARPCWGVITAIGEAHRETFGSPEAIIRGKAELAHALPSDGLLIIGDDERLQRAVRGCRCRTLIVGTSAACDARAERVEQQPGNLRFRLQGRVFRLPVWGEHYLTSALATIVAAREMGMSWSEIAERLAEFRPVDQRCRVIRHGGITVIDDSYNSSPSAARAALAVLANIEPAARRVAILGDMAELGRQTPADHWRLGYIAVVEGRADRIIACGAWGRLVARGAYAAGLARHAMIVCDTTAEAALHALGTVCPGDVVLVKGSRMMAMEQVVEALTNNCPAEACDHLTTAQ